MPNRARQYEALWREIQPCVRCRDHRILGSRLASASVFIPLPPLRPQPSVDLPVRYLLVGAEPSDDWRPESPTLKAKSPTSSSDALRRIKAGYRNYTGNLRAIALHFAARTWLIDADTESFAITDLAKCAMDRPLADSTPERYAVCADWLLREISVLGPKVLIAVGGRPSDQLQRMALPPGLKVFRVPHFSRLAVSSWTDDVPMNPRNVPVTEFAAYTRDVLQEHHPGNQTFTVTPAIRRLLALYRSEFGRIRRSAGRS